MNKYSEDFIKLWTRLTKAEKRYDQFLDTLEPEQQKILEEFRAANMAVINFMSKSAYENGVRAGRKTERAKDGQS